jgi:hypothetical protein
MKEREKILVRQSDSFWRSGESFSLMGFVDREEIE